MDRSQIIAVNMILPQADLFRTTPVSCARSPNTICKTLAISEHLGAGVYADVLKPGIIRRGDAVHCQD